MPQTVNGIGTWYYGKKNLSTRRGVCSQCGQDSVLSSYDTKLWFVILYIPIIPLGRKHIMDECRLCQRHFAADQDKYEMSKQLGISGARNSYDEHRTVENALILHMQFLGFHQMKEAAEFRESALAEFPQSAELRAVFATQLESMQIYDEVWPLYQQAYDLQPHQPDARIGYARFLMTQDRLDEARDILDFLIEPGAGQLHPLGPLDVLAMCYQQANRHEEALALWSVVLREYPQAGEDREFRKVIKKSEKAAGRMESLLTAQGFSLWAFFNGSSGRYSTGQRWAFFTGLALLLVLAGAVGLSEYWRTHRQLTVINVAPDKLAVQIAIDGGPAFPNPTAIPIVEGAHRVSISGAITDEFDINLSTDFFSRLWSDPVWILNVGGGASLYVAEITYAAHPVPPKVTSHVGQRFIAVPHVDYLFTEPPQTMRVDSKSSNVKKVAVSRETVAPQSGLRGIENGDDLVRYASTWLTADRSNAKLLDAIEYAVTDKPAARQAMIKFLEAGLWQEPVEVRWHRCYTRLLKADGVDADVTVAKVYDNKLADNPKSAVLLYLRGRVSSTNAEEESFYDRSLEQDRAFGWPLLAKAWMRLGRAEWSQALDALTQAEATGIQDDLLPRSKHLALLGLGRGQELIPVYQQRLQGNFDVEKFTDMMLLQDAFASINNPAGAAEASHDLGKKLPMEVRATPELRAALSNPAAYMFGQWNEFVALPGRANYWTPHRMLVNGETKQAVASPEFASMFNDEFMMLCATTGLLLEGHQAEAGQWRDKACEILRRQGHHERLMADLLQQKVEPTAALIDEIAAPAQTPMIFLATMTCLDPDRRSLFVPRLKSLNVTHMPPYQQVKAVLEKYGQ